MRHLKFMSVGLALTGFLMTFFIFKNTKNFLGTDSEWKYYFSLTGFIIFSIMLLIVIAAMLISKRKK